MVRCTAIWRPPHAPEERRQPATGRARDLAGRIKLVKVDIDKNPRLSRRFEVQAVPTLLILNKGETVARQTGTAPAHALRSWVEQAMKGLRTIAGE